MTSPSHFSQELSSMRSIFNSTPRAVGVISPLEDNHLVNFDSSRRINEIRTFVVLILQEKKDYCKYLLRLSFLPGSRRSGKRKPSPGFTTVFPFSPMIAIPLAVRSQEENWASVGFAMVAKYESPSFTSITRTK